LYALHTFTTSHSIEDDKKKKRVNKPELLRYGDFSMFFEGSIAIFNEGHLFNCETSCVITQCCLQLETSRKQAMRRR